jgi:hypothetical protein
MEMAVPSEKTFVPYKHLGLAIEKPPIPNFVRTFAAQNNLPEKETLHISVIVTKNAHILWRALESRGSAEEMLASTKSLFDSYKWEYTVIDEYFLHERAYSRKDLDENGDTDMEEHTRRSIVQKVLLPDLPEFYEKVNELAGISLTIPVPHITLFALLGRGIGINSAEDFARFTKQPIKP